MEECQSNKLIDELECVSKDDRIVIHVLDFGFLSRENLKLCGMFSTSMFDKSNSSLIKFEDKIEDSDFLFDSCKGSDLSEHKQKSTYNNKEFVATLLISNTTISNSSVNNRSGLKCNFDTSRNFRLYTSKELKQNANFTVGGIHEKKNFKGVEMEISICSSYPTTPFKVYYISFYNICKSDKKNIKLSSQNYFLNDKKNTYSLYDFVNLIKTKLSEITNGKIKHFENDELYQSDYINSYEKDKEYATPQLNDFESESYRLCFGRFEDNFEVIKILGFGGFGSVFMVRERFGGQCVYAIKQIPLSSKHKNENQILINEATMLACLNHEKIVRYYHAWVQESIDGDSRYIRNDILDRNFCNSFAPELISQFSAIAARYITNKYLEVSTDRLNKEEKRENTRKSIYLYIQMEYCSGYSLQFVIDQGILINNNKLIWHIFYQIIQGLSYLHGKGVVHRDLKPSNIFLQLENNQNEDKDENWYMVKLGDFGLTTFVDIFEDSSDSLNLSSIENKELSAGVGTLFYMAPEQSKGNNYNQSADMFSLGVILFEMYHPPFTTGMERANVLSQLTKYMSFPKNFNIPSKVQTLIRSLLSNDPNERPTSHQLLFNEWILRQAKLYLQVNQSRENNSKNMDKGSSSEYFSMKICDMISRNPHIHESNQIIDTLFSLEKRSLDKLNFQTRIHLSYLPFRINTYSFKGNQFNSNSFVVIHDYYKKRLELITFIKNIFRIHGATEVEIPILIPKNNNINIGIDENTQYNLNDDDNNISIKEDYLALLSSDTNHNNSPQIKSKKTKRNSKANSQNKLKREINEVTSPSENPLTVLLLDKAGIPLILCNNILKNMSVQLGDGQGIKPGTVIKRFYIDSIYTQDNFINALYSNNKEIVTNTHPKEILIGAYEIVVKINDIICEEFDTSSFIEPPKSNYSINGNINILPLWYYNFAAYYDMETVITAINTLRPFEMLFERHVLVWGDSQLFIALLESWICIKYDKAKYLQLWLQDMIPKGFSKRNLFNILQNITLTSLAEYANCYGCFDIENENTDLINIEINDQVIAYYLGLKILSYSTILEKVVEYILNIINDFKGTVNQLVNTITRGASELFNLFENEKKKFIITCESERYRRIAKMVRYPLHLNFINNKNSVYNTQKHCGKHESNKYLYKEEFEINYEFITPNLFKVLYRISFFDKLLKTVNLAVSQTFLDPMLCSSNNFFESGFFFYLFSRENSSDQINQTLFANKECQSESFRNNANHSICKVSCIMDLMLETKQTSCVNPNSSQFTTKKQNIVLLIKGGRFDNWLMEANSNNVISYKNTKTNNETDIISAVGFEIILERILYKLLSIYKYKKPVPRLLNQQITYESTTNCGGINVFIFNNVTNSIFQRKTVKLKQMLVLNGISCQRNINCGGNVNDTTKLKNSIKHNFPYLHWIIYVLRANTCDNRKTISNNEGNSTLINPNSIDPQIQSSSSEVKYRIECCSSENHIIMLAKEFIYNHSLSSNSNNLEITFENENFAVQFLVNFYNSNN